LLGATLSEGYTYKYLVWDAADGNLLYRGEQADSIVGSFYDALHKYDPLLAHQERDGTILLTNRETGVIIHRLIPDPSVKGWLSLSSFSPDGRFLAKYTGVPHSDAPRTDRRVFVWDIRTGEQVFVFDTGTYVNVVNDVSWSPDGTRLASGLGSLGGGGRPGEVGIWDMSTGTLAQPAIGFSYSVQSVAWSPDGKLIAVGSGGYTNGGELTLLDATSGEQTATWNEHRRPVLHLAWSSDSKLLVAASQDLLTVWDIEAGAPQHVLHAVVEPESMAFSPDASQLAVVLVGEEGQAAIVWDSGSGKTLNAPVVMSTYEDWFDLSSCPENQITAGLDPGSVYSCEGGLRADVVSERGRGYLPAEINVWNRNSERFHLSLTQEGTQLFSMSFSPDEAWLAIGLGAERCHGCYRVTSIDENYVLLWNMLDTTAQLTLYGHTGQVNNLAWAPDGSMLASSSEDGTILIWPVSP
jgi:WD40 repeat protein